MRLQLSEAEQSDLVFHPGDYYEILSGNYTLSVKNRYKPSTFANSRQQLGFFFEFNDKSWGTRELGITTVEDIPNGPALLIMYRRAKQVNAFGLVHIASKKSLHAKPLSSLELIRTGSKFQALDKAHTGRVLKGFAAGMVAGILTGGLGAAPVAKKVMGPGASDAEMAATLRMMMFRIARDAEQYWER